MISMDFAYDSTTEDLRARRRGVLRDPHPPQRGDLRRADRRPGQPVGHAADHGGAQGEGPGRGPVEPVPPRPRARRRPHQPPVRTAVRGHGPQPVPGPRGVQLRRAGHGKHGTAGAVRHAGAEAALPGAAARGPNPLGLLDDRATGRLERRHQHLDPDRARRRRVRHHRPQVVHLRRDVTALRRC